MNRIKHGIFILSICIWGADNIPSLYAQINPDTLNYSRFNSGFVSDVYNGARGVSFNTGWKFNLGNVTGAEQPGFNDASWKNIFIPHDWSIELPFNQNSAAQAGGGYLDGGIGWYRKSFTLPQSYSQKRITIQFDGVYMNSEVWINGTSLGIRPYGYSTFEYNLTPYLKFGSANVIAVKVNNNQKNSRWYSGSGIYRNIWLTATSQVNVSFCGSFITTPSVTSANAKISISTSVQNNFPTGQPNQAIYLVSTIYDKTGKQIVATVTSNTVSITSGNTNAFAVNTNISNPNLWSIDNPYLYIVKTKVYANGTVADVFTSTLGVRYYSFDVNKGFSLNGKFIKLHGSCMHHDLGSLGAAQNYRALERQVEILKSFGDNAIRTSHNPPAPELLEICDRLGVVVMDEVFDCWKVGKNNNDYHLYFDAWAQKDVQNWIRRDRNHPSVILWSIGNEIKEESDASGITIANNLVKWVRTDDTTRYTTMALTNPNSSNMGNILDVAGFNYQNGGTFDNLHSSHPKWKLMGSETSSAVRSRGVYHFPPTSNILTNADQQCSNYDNSVVAWGISAESSWKLDRDRPFVIGEFNWTGFDYIGEPTPYGWSAKSSYFGIVDMCGFPKDIYYFFQSQWTTAPMVHILPHWNWTGTTTIPVWTYSNCDSVRLYLNGNSLGAKKFQNGAVHLEWQIPFQAGTLVAKAYKNGNIAAADTVRTAGAATKIHLKADRNAIHADNTDLAFIETDILDANNVLVPDAGNQVTYSITGPGQIVGVDNGNAISLESFKGNVRKAFNGKALAIVKSSCADGSILVTATSPGLQSASVTIKSSKFSAKPVIVENGNTLNAFPVGYSYQWYLNGNSISGATDQTYGMPQPGGSYKVEITDGRGCVTMSDPAIATSVGEVPFTITFNIFPSPVNDKIIIETGEETSDFMAKIFSIQGKLLKENVFHNHPVQMDVKDLASGVYIIEVSNSQGKATKKFIKE